MLNIPEKEKEILKFWKEKDIFKKSLEKDNPKGNFIFYEGPPTANGRPGIHHVEARAFKDLIPRYKTMQGYRVERKAGWDTHGLPVELEVEKQLGLKDKKAVEKFGIKKFNQKCKESVWKYQEEWEKMTERIGFWIDMENPYVTYHNDYIESLWWIIKQAYEKNLLYKGYKVVPQCPRCGTALSSHEVAQGYKNIKETSVYIKFKIKNKDNEYILAWTTTPWTLPGNVALAVGEEIEYVKIKQNNEIYYLAKNLVNKVFGTDTTGSFTIVQDDILGKDLIGLEYEPLFPGIITEKDNNYKNAFKLYPANFVSTEEGTGVVHTAVMYGQEDYELGEKIGLPKVHTVNLDGTFNELVPQWQGKFVKNVEEEIVADLKNRGLLFKTEMYKHDYPFCWRCDSPLIYYARDSWYFKMSSLREKLIENNKTINWEPEHIKQGRFGEWLNEVKDWAISRERYWGTPIPIWFCEKCENIKVIGSIEELEKLSGKKIDDMHRPFIDEITFQCEKCGGQMKRISEVMDCWFDSGAMPFAQLHYPFENKEAIDSNKKYPADFISEAVDQTRGWFYTLLAVATILDKEAPYKNVICLGHLLDKKGQKMSKHIGNVIDPWEMMDKYGADSVRWYLYTINHPGDPKKFDEQALKETGRVFMTLLNVVKFYKMFVENREFTQIDTRVYANNINNILDKWILAKLNLLINDVTKSLDVYDIFSSARKIEDFITELSVWYIRRSRGRFKGEDEQDKNQAIFTLGKVLFELTKLLAPFTPFIAEHIYQELGKECKSLKESVHLEDWPKVKPEFLDQKVIDYMEVTRKVVELALAKRAEAGIKVRQPLLELRIMNYELSQEYLDLIKDEVNVKNIICEKGTGDLSVELNTELNTELIQEGLLRELTRAI
ncbi:isoleucine--tRNA ligase, partial [Patescibacteria group bacterium]|nr:isoleucine--tRNA ligase [Patescibacteria group bacterium]